MRYLRAIAERAEGDGESTGPMWFVASTDLDARDGLIIEQSGWQVTDYQANPVIMWAHDYSQPPIGRAVEVEVAEHTLRVRVQFDEEDVFAASVARKYRQGFLNAVSVGWDTLEAQGERITRADLLEVSAVPVPADPHALVERQRRALAALGRQMAEAVEATGEPPGDARQAQGGSMIALLPADPGSLVVEGGDPPEALHVTLAFLGEEGAELPEETLAAVQGAASEAAEAVGPFEARVAGYGVLGEADPPATVLLLDAPELVAVHQAVWEALAGVAGLPEQWPGWIPHLTLGYGDLLEAAAGFHGQTLSFDRIAVALGEEMTETALGETADPPPDEGQDEEPDEDMAKAFLAAVARHPLLASA